MRKKRGKKKREERRREGDSLCFCHQLVKGEVCAVARGAKTRPRALRPLADTAGREPMLVLLRRLW